MFTFPYATAITKFGVDLSGLTRGLAQANTQINTFAAQASRKLGLAVRAGGQVAGATSQFGTPGRGIAGVARLGGLASMTGLSLGGAALAGAGGTIAMFGKLGSDAEEMEARFRQVFRGLSDEAEGFADKLGDSLGRSKYALMDMMTNFQLEFTASGLGRGEALKMSQALQRLAIDLAAFHNMGEQDVAGRLFRALTGNHRALYELGIVMNQAALQEETLRMGWQKEFATLTSLEKMQVRMSYITRATADAQGQAAREADNLAGRWRALTALISEAGVAIGKMFVPPLREALGLVVKLANATKDLVQIPLGADKSARGRVNNIFQEQLAARFGLEPGARPGMAPDPNKFIPKPALQRWREMNDPKFRDKNIDAFLEARGAVIRFGDALRAQGREIMQRREERLNADDKIVADVVADAARQALEATGRGNDYWDMATGKPKQKGEATPGFSGLAEFADLFQANALKPLDQEILESNKRQEETLRAIDTNQQKLIDLEKKARIAVAA